MITTHSNSDRLLVIDADGMQMRQILQNPIGNALKFRQEDVVPLVKGIVCHSFGISITQKLSTRNLFTGGFLGEFIS